MLMLLGLFVSSLIVFVVSVRLRPRDALTPSTVGGSAVIYIAVVAVLFTTHRASGSQTVQFRVLAPDGKPVADATIAFRHRFAGDGSSGRPPASGSLHTDSSGLASLPTDRRHEIRGEINHPEFVEVEFWIDRAWSSHTHSISISWPDPRRANPEKGVTRSGDGFAHFHLPTSRNMIATFYLPRRGIDEPLPYPPYER